jgi:phenylalanyl-tRNA synthetase beta subunit (EC 6.1.1.20)
MLYFFTFAFCQMLFWLTTILFITIYFHHEYFIQLVKELPQYRSCPIKVSEILTSLGLEVGSMEEIQSVKGGLEGLVVGEVLTCAKHSGADKLSVTTVNVGFGDPLPGGCVVRPMWLPDRRL